MVLGVCRRVLHDAHDAEDAFQATFLVLVRKARSVSDPESLGNWLYGVAYRTSFKVRSDAARRRFKEGQATSAECSTVEEPCQGELRRVLDDELSRLPEKYRAPVVLCYLEGRTQAEAAVQLGCPRKTVTTRLARACDKLRARLTRRGLAPSAGALSALLTQESAAALVPAGLSGGTVQAASSLALAETVLAGAVSARISHLARGVLRSMFLTRIKIVSSLSLMAACALTVASLVVQGAMAPPTGNRVAVRQTAPVRELQLEEKQESKEITEFHKLYALSKGIDVRRIAPPFHPTREAYYRQVLSPQSIDAPPGAIYFRSTGDRLHHYAFMTTGDGLPLSSVPHAMQLKLYPQQVEGPKELLGTEIVGDFVVRMGASAEKVIPALEDILRKECGLPVKLSLREVDRKVIVVKGKYTARQREGQNDEGIKIYAQLRGDVPNGGGSGDFSEFLNCVGEFIGRQVIDGGADLPNAPSFRWRYYERSKATEEERRVDRNERLVLKHLTEQTSLTFTEETRRVRVLLVERAE
jgi:RNA polymerase sigma factor (sigma-70 family)